jgi:exopolysaccharide biosynthesis polyprenyl glycosylphosphotransferase
MVVEERSATPSLGMQCAPARRLASWGLHLSERRVLLLAGDLTAMSLALAGALWLRPQIFGLAFPASPTGLIFVPVWWLVLWAVWMPISIILDGYDLRLAASAPRSATQMASCAGIVSAIYLIVPIMSAPLVRSRLGWMLFALLAVALVGGWRIVYALLFRQAAFLRRALIVGAGASGQELTRVLDAIGVSSGVELVGYVDDNPALVGSSPQGKPVLGPSREMLSLVEEQRVDDVVIAITNWASIRPELMERLMQCWVRGVRVTPMPLYYEQAVGALPVNHLGHNVFTLVGSQGARWHRLWLALRRLMDIVIGGVGLVVTAALSPLIAAAIWLDCRGPILYHQIRVGRSGRFFRICKFRSMIPGAEANGPVWAEADDSRITRVGLWMRRTRLDELPQFWNLLNGTMTLIGPRPERPEFVSELELEIPYYTIRHAVTPGLTGWAQVRYGYGKSIEDARRKLEYDLYYLKNRGPLLDGVILLYTVRVILQMQGR